LSTIVFETTSRKGWEGREKLRKKLADADELIPKIRVQYIIREKV